MVSKYKTNADYYCTFENGIRLRKTGLIDNVRESGRGHVVLDFRNSGLSIELSNKGNLLIHWHSEKEIEKFYPLLRNVLATSDGSPVTIEPLTSTLYNIPYGVFGFSIPWGRKKDLYVKFNRLFSAFLFGFVSGILLLFSLDDLLWFLRMWITLFFIFVLADALLSHHTFGESEKS